MALFAASQNEKVSRESSARDSEALRSRCQRRLDSLTHTHTPRDKFQFSSSAHGALALLSHSTVPVARIFFYRCRFLRAHVTAEKKRMEDSFLRVVETDVLRMIQFKKK
jgi:hypothetical protein